jgi:hypothetical protein
LFSLCVLRVLGGPNLKRKNLVRWGCRTRLWRGTNWESQLEGLFDFLFDADDGGIDAAVERRAGFRHGFRSFGWLVDRFARSRGYIAIAAAAATATDVAATGVAAVVVISFEATTKTIKQAALARIAIVMAAMATATATTRNHLRLATCVAAGVAAIVLTAEFQFEIELRSASVIALIARRLAGRLANGLANGLANRGAMMFFFVTTGIATAVTAIIIAAELRPHPVEEAWPATLVATGRGTSAATTRPGGDHRSGCGWRGWSWHRVGAGHPSRSQQQVRYVHE